MRVSAARPHLWSVTKMRQLQRALGLGNFAEPLAKGIFNAIANVYACLLLHTTSIFIDVAQGMFLLCFPMIFSRFCIATIHLPRIRFGNLIPTLGGNRTFQSNQNKWRTHGWRKCQRSQYPLGFFRKPCFMALSPQRC